MTLAAMHERLLASARERVRNGDLTERGLARLAGISQPHLHNVLKGVRSLSTEHADSILQGLQITPADLLRTAGAVHASRQVPLLSGLLGCETRDFDPDRTAGQINAPEHVAAAAERPLGIRLGIDTHAWPRFEPRDLVLIDQSERVRTQIDKDATYLTMTSRGPRLRYVRFGGVRLYLPSERTLAVPARWESVERDERGLPAIVLGRVIWASRQFQTHRDWAPEA